MNRKASAASVPATDAADVSDEEGAEESTTDIKALIPWLLTAVKNDETENALDLINKGVPLSSSDTPWSPLQWAALNGNLVLVSKLVEGGAASAYFEESKALLGMDDSDEAPKKRDPVSTPLHWAAIKGNRGVVFFLLQAGFSPNDVDEIGNTPLHLACANSHIGTVKVLLDNGADSEACNMFMNRPMDVTPSQDVRKLLRAQHEASKRAPKTSTVVSDTNDDDKNTDTTTGSPEGNPTMYTLAQKRLRDMIDTQSSCNSVDPQAIGKLEEAISYGESMFVTPDLIESGKQTVKNLSLSQELAERIELILSNEPITSQRAYTSYVNGLDRCLRKAQTRGSAHPLFKNLIEKGEQLKKKSHAEFWLKMACDKVSVVKCADETTIGLIKYFENAIKAAEAEKGHAGLTGDARKILVRMNCEVELQRAMDEIPTEVRLPIEDAAKDYWDPAMDIGHIDDTTEGFPLPPPESEYVWVPSYAFQKHKASLELMEDRLKQAESGGANEEIVASAKTQVEKLTDEVQQLEVKDAGDKEAGIAVAAKAAKKLKKKKKK